MMKAYYIPTSILNIGNILSTDSISPSAFYSKRNFGDSHWRKIEENNFDNVILLYAKPFYFSCSKEERDDGAMFIQIVTDEIFKELIDGVYLCDRTIYFDWNTKFIFLSPEDRTKAISLSQISDSTKLLRIYQEKRMIVEKCNSEHYYIPESEAFSLYVDSIREDFIINKMKGLLYGYYIGAYLTLSPQRVGAMRAYHNIYDIFASLNPSIVRKDKKDTPLNVVRKYIEEEEKSANEERSLLYPVRKEIIIKNLLLEEITNTILKNTTEKILVKAWINNIFVKEWPKNVNVAKRVLLEDITDKSIEVLKDSWAESYSREFLNDLRHYIAGESFHHKFTNDLYSSLAIFILRGDDWKDMLGLMRKFDMYDYRMAFAFYGVFWGFASLLHNFTKMILEQENKEYVKKIYDEFYHLIFGKPIAPIEKTTKSPRERILFAHERMPKDLLNKKANKSFEDAFKEWEINNNQDTETFIKILKNQSLWKKGDRIKEFVSLLDGNTLFTQ